MRTAVYIDGFNLYYGLKGTAFKWLDLEALIRQVLPGVNLSATKYFTAIVKSRATDPQQTVRQLAYLRALETLPTLKVIRGHFLTKPAFLPRASCFSMHIDKTRVMKTEEKGSDVNLASPLIVDGFKGDYDEAWVMSNDSDLYEPIRLVRSELKKRIGIINPKPFHNRSRALEKIVPPTDFLQVSHAHLAKSQFPIIVKDGIGAVTKPTAWL